MKTEPNRTEIERSKLTQPYAKLLILETTTSIKITILAVYTMLLVTIKPTRKLAPAADRLHISNTGLGSGVN